MFSIRKISLNLIFLSKIAGGCHPPGGAPQFGIPPPPPSPPFSYFCLIFSAFFYKIFTQKNSEILKIFKKFSRCENFLKILFSENWSEWRSLRNSGQNVGIPGNYSKKQRNPCPGRPAETRSLTGIKGIHSI